MASSTSNSMFGNDTTDKATCGICHRQVSRYTCPLCNAPYCSLTCFRSDNHAQCSEAFYKQQLESDIRTQPSASMDERKRMLEVLKKFEEEAADEDLLGGDEGEERERDDLEERLSRIDLSSASSAEVWNALTSGERAAFLDKVADPASPFLQELLRHELDITLPWWEAPVDPLENLDSQGSSKVAYGNRPAMEDIPKVLLGRPSGPDAGPPLLYNICAVLVAYSFATRLFGVSPLSQSRDQDDLKETRQLLRTLVPFVADKRSTVLFGSMDDVVTDMWTRLVDSERADRTSFVLFLLDAARLLTPERIALVDATSSGRGSLEEAPQCDCLLALSDLMKLFRPGGGRSEKETPASMKLRFYAAHVMTLPPPLLTAFSAEVGSRAHAIEGEGRLAGSNESTARHEARPVPRIESQETDKRPMIEEL